MQLDVVTMMRVSIWVLLLIATPVALFWLVLVLLSNFRIWTHESNIAGLALQSGLLLFPVALIFGLRQSKGSFSRTITLFCISWVVALTALAIFNF